MVGGIQRCVWECTMEFGVHLPQIGWEKEPLSLERVLAVAMAAERLGFGTISANDHLVYGRPWLDGPTALAAVLGTAPRARLMTSVALPVVRGPFALAKALSAIDVLSGGRVEAGLGPGSSASDYALVGIPFEERWQRFDEAVGVMRTLWDGAAEPFVGRYYDTTGITLSPAPVCPKGPPIWIGSWGSTAGLRRVARLADGWLASGYNTTPEAFTTTWSTLRGMLEAEGRDPSTFPCTMATTWLHVTEDDAEARAVNERLSQMLRRPLEEVQGRLPVGSPAACVDLLGRYQAAGLQRVLLWPVQDEVHQLERVAVEIIPQLGRAS
jgi:alkanesulfonate monooxygenase SsuD/methylene tetrahydromethanopterin reductase-like flavin-dependent oxidoreductase (luciferase family)